MNAESQTVEFDLSGVGLRASGLSEPLAARWREDWAPFAAAVDRPVLDLRVAVGKLPPPETTTFRPKAMTAELDAVGGRYAMAEGRATIDGAGDGSIELARDLGTREYFTLQNFVRACLARRLPASGGLLVHAAGLVIDGRAFVLVGAEGAGKSTWARLGEAAGAHVVSDDLVLLRRAPNGFELLGAPFRSTHLTALRRGNWPLAGLLFPRHGPRPALGEVSAIVARARVVANLPFVAEALERDARLAELTGALATTVPTAELTFAEDPGFVPLLRAWRV